MKINIEGLNKAQILMHLWNGSRQLGLGFMHTVGQASVVMNESEAQSLIHSMSGSMYFDYLRGRVMKIDLSRPMMETALYNRDNGFEAAETILKNFFPDHVFSKPRSKITLANLKYATSHEVFEQVARHLLTQGERSHVIPLATNVDKYQCAYRGGSDNKCAAGCLIDDAEYKKEFEHTSWEALVMEGHVPSSHSELIVKLQFIHDQTKPPQWREGLLELAESEFLNSEFIEKEFPLTEA